MKDHPAVIPFVDPAVSPQGFRFKANPANARRVPSALPEARRREAVMAVKAGRSVHQVAKEHSVSEGVVFELWLRDIEKRRAA